MGAAAGAEAPQIDGLAQAHHLTGARAGRGAPGMQVVEHDRRHHRTGHGWRQMDVFAAVHDENTRGSRISRRQLQRQAAVDARDRAVDVVGQLLGSLGHAQRPFARELGDSPSSRV